MNFTHVELLLSEPPCIFSNEEDLKRLIEILQEHDIGVILDDQSEFSPESLTRCESRARLQLRQGDGCRAHDFLTLLAGEHHFEWRWDRQWTWNILYYLGDQPAGRKRRDHQLLDRVSRAASGRVFAAAFT